ncbi:4-hydroxy-tetrahydrodipicolinate reductase [Actinomadura sp. WMMB 499]|uniref:4-hydroxy-tetrahydrodipicolinate reductase n=1 Tax=Actinomadura sp. WMMB 499 TaxID=1219491 RepID=UPI001247E1BE|nr:4-hydroxy-tetrahydrodipicolinate reductase [Actinomadura sp. WMMB 499]QFG25572.1 4-hydroxy-tetrahydrodipicolinate reductase [Actinomadura sp. WMMB 499]
MIKVGVLGAQGRMGSEVCRAVQGADDMELVATVDVGDALDPLAAAEVVVDFTRPDAVMDNLRWCVEHGLHAVVGTSGFEASRFDTVRSWLTDGSAGNVVIAPNFGIGAVLMMHFAQKAAPLFESVEIIETHHPNKVDAPSGTAHRTAELVAAARAEAEVGPSPDATTSELDGARGADVDGVRVHAVRMSGAIAHQEVVLGGHGELFTIRHDSMNRESFMPGVLLAVRRVPNLDRLTIGIESLLGL